jgi:iron complex outermembrane receptor protein
MKDQVTVPELDSVLANPSAYPASTVKRDTNNLTGIFDSGSLIYVMTPFQNGNNLKTDGIDLDVVWKLFLGDWGTLRTELQWTHVFHYTNTLDNGVAYEYVGTQGPYGLSSAAGTPADRANLIIGWTRGPWNVTGTVRYVSGYQSKHTRADTECIQPPLDTPPDCHVASFTTLDLSASYSGFKNWQIFGSIINVFNRLAPFNPAAAYGGVNYNYNWAYSGATGTQFNLGVRYTFE